jgi:hypothetical protein
MKVEWFCEDHNTPTENSNEQQVDESTSEIVKLFSQFLFSELRRERAIKILFLIRKVFELRSGFHRCVGELVSKYIKFLE